MFHLTLQPALLKGVQTGLVLNAGVEFITGAMFGQQTKAEEAKDRLCTLGR